MSPTIVRKDQFGSWETDRAATKLFDDVHALMREAADEITRLRDARDLRWLMKPMILEDPLNECRPYHVVVEKFGKRRVCKVTAYGEPQPSYTSEQILWVERGEDEYAMPHYKPPFCVLYREDWLMGYDTPQSNQGV
jgi:hypothetical protein